MLRWASWVRLMADGDKVRSQLGAVFVAEAAVLGRLSWAAQVWVHGAGNTLARGDAQADGALAFGHDCRRNT